MLTSLAGDSGHLQLGLPQSVPPQYNTLKDCSPDVLSMRLRVLYHFSDLMYKSWRLLNLDTKSQVHKVLFLCFLSADIFLCKKATFIAVASSHADLWSLKSITLYLSICIYCRKTNIEILQLSLCVVYLATQSPKIYGTALGLLP